MHITSRTVGAHPRHHGVVRAAIGLGAVLVLAPVGMGGVASAAPAHHSVVARHAALLVDRGEGALGRAAAIVARSVDSSVAQVRPAITCTDSWKVATAGLWNTAANWSTGSVPTSTSAACITLAGTYTVTLIGSGSVGTLTLGEHQAPRR